MFISAHARHSTTFLALTSALIALLAACTSPTERGSSISAHAALEGSGDPTEDDDDLRFVKEHGFSGIAFATTCVSKQDGSSDIDGDSLPVGGGRHLECLTAASASRVTTSAMSQAGDHWCVLGDATSWTGAGDDRLAITLTSRPSDAPWTLSATHEGDPISISRVEAFGAWTWPIYVNLTYSTTDMKKEVEGKSCDEVFGL